MTNISNSIYDYFKNHSDISRSLFYDYVIESVNFKNLHNSSTFQYDVITEESNVSFDKTVRMNRREVQGNLYILANKMKLVIPNLNKDTLNRICRYFITQRINEIEKLFFYGDTNKSNSLLGLKQYCSNSHSDFTWNGTQYNVNGVINHTNINNYLLNFINEYRSKTKTIPFYGLIMYVSNKFLATLVKGNHNTNNFFIEIIDCDSYENTYKHLGCHDITIRYNKNVLDNEVFIVPRNDSILFTNHYDCTNLHNFLFHPNVSYDKYSNMITSETSFAFGFPNINEYGMMHNFELKD